MSIQEYVAFGAACAVALFGAPFIAGILWFVLKYLFIAGHNVGAWLFDRRHRWGGQP